jgi:hypothetical protein
MQSLDGVSPGMRHGPKLTARGAGRKDNPGQGLRREAEALLATAPPP